MAIAKNVLAKKAMGFTESISKMTPAERCNQPTKLFGEDYNSLRSLAERDYPELSEILPPQVQFIQLGMNNEWFTVQRYSEIHAFAEQMFHLLS